MMTFENFKPCLVFSNKFRIFSSFLQFFEAEANRHALLSRDNNPNWSPTLLMKLKSVEDPSKGKSVEDTRVRSNTPQPKVRRMQTVNVSHRTSMDDPTSSIEL